MMVKIIFVHKVIELLVVIAIMVVLAVMLFCGIGSLIGGIDPDYSVGSRSGQVIKCSKKGVLFKSWEIEVKQSDFGLKNQTSQGGEWSNVFSCSTQDNDVGQKVESLIGRNVKIKYSQWLIGPMGQNTPYTVTDVEEIGKLDLIERN